MNAYGLNTLKSDAQIKMHPTKTLSYAVVGLFLFTNTVYAEWFLGADILPSPTFYQLNSLAIEEPVPAGSFDYREDGLKVYSGYKTSDNFSFELEYRNDLDFGAANIYESEDILSGSLRSERYDSNAFLLSGQRTFNVDEGKYLYFRGGLYNWDINTSDLTFSEEQDFSRNGTDIFYSIGAAFDFSDSFEIRAEWERFAVDEEDVDIISTELRFNF